MVAVRRNRIIVVLGIVAGAVLFAAPMSHAAIVWDGEAGTQWWFDPVNWNQDSNGDMMGNDNDSLPPGNATSGATDTQININSIGLPGGEGVVYDPTNDPGFPPPGTITFPPFGWGPQLIRELYLSRQTDEDNLLTIKGDLTIQDRAWIGRSSDTPSVITTGRINQLSGSVLITDALDLGSTDTSGNVTGENYGNGIYDYRGGILEVGLPNGAELALSPSSSTVGAAGIGRFIMHNPDTAGRVRAFDYNAAAGAGIFLRLADGDTTGVGISEFHFENGGTRPIQVARHLILNNGETTTGGGAGGIRSPRLDLVLHEAPCLGAECVPQDVGLFDVAFSDASGNSTTGAGTNGDFFSSVDGSTVLTQGAMVSADFLGTTYNWTISYEGNITWSDAANSVVDAIAGTGGVDVVLIGHSSIPGAGTPGDHNGDGVVDAADYALWRSNPGAYDGSQGYTDWVNNFGAPGAGAGPSLAVQAVPEPRTLVGAAIALGALLVVCSRRRASHFACAAAG